MSVNDEAGSNMEKYFSVIKQMIHKLEICFLTTCYNKRESVIFRNIGIAMCRVISVSVSCHKMLSPWYLLKNVI